MSYYVILYVLCLVYKLNNLLIKQNIIIKLLNNCLLFHIRMEGQCLVVRCARRHRERSVLFLLILIVL
jgi:hypothetical protein